MAQVIDFSTLTEEDVSKLDFSDPELLQYIGVKPLHDYVNDESCSRQERYKNAKGKFLEMLVVAAAAEVQRAAVFSQLSSLQKIITNLKDNV